MGSIAQNTLESILRENPSRATVLEYFDINYPLFLDKSLEEIADMYAINLLVLEEAILNVRSSLSEFQYEFLELPVLIAYLQHTHHEYTRAKLPHIKRNMERLKQAGLLKVFSRFSRDMSKHILLEEQVIFPFILKLVSLNETFNLQSARELLTHQSSEVLYGSHTSDDDVMQELREMTGNYSWSERDPVLYQVLMTDLSRLEQDIARHAWLEDHILFKKARAEENLLRERLQLELRKN